MTKYALLLTILLLTAACRREPELHLYESQPTEMTFVFAEIELDVYWDYILETGVRYDWRTEWYYGWNDEDRRIFGEIGYTQPNEFNIRRYYTGSTPYAHHTKVLSNTIEGNIRMTETTKLQAKCRESTKEIDNMLVPKLKQELNKATNAKDAENIARDIEYWQNMSNKLSKIGKETNNPYEILDLNNQIQRETGGKDAIQVVNDLIREFNPAFKPAPAN